MANPDRHHDSSKVVRVRRTDLALLEKVRDRLEGRQGRDDPHLSARLMQREAISLSDASGAACRTYLRKR